MAIEVKLPEIADGVDKADVISVLVKEGDHIEVDTPLIEIESEKASFTVPSKQKGRVTKVQVKVGDKVSVGQPFLILEDADSAPATAPAPAPAAPKAVPPPANPTPTGMSSLDPDRRQAAKNIEASEEPPISAERLAPARPRSAGEDVIPAGPTVRRIAREIGVDLRQVIGTGPRGRIRLEDLDPFIKGFISQRGGAPAAVSYAPAPIELPDFSKFGPIRRVKAESLRRKIAERMQQSWSTVPHVHQFFEADITELVDLQKRLKERVKAQGGSLTITVLMIKALAVVLKEFPEFNASWDGANGEIIYKDYIHIGVAVDTPSGLIVPVLRDVDKKTILQLSKELPELAARTRERKTSMDDLRGGSFTVSNLGGIGGTFFTPIINVPEVAILGIGRNQRRPVYDAKGNIVPRDIAPLALGYDHRIIDGAQAARFVVRYTEVLENFEAVILGF
jgi:pyruvate dehydrogenase E2 component (dihydrolipoamide acetyltransferase)